MSSTFNARSAAVYEMAMGRWSRRLARKLIDFGSVASGETVLDAGCGTGSLTEVLASNTGAASIVGVDVEEMYLEAARQKIRDQRVAFQNSDVTALPFADDTFDRAYSSLVLQFVPETLKAVREMRRVVRPGGNVIAAVWDSFGGVPDKRLCWDTAATLGLASDAALRNFYFRPMTKPGDMAAAWNSVGLRQIEQSSIAIRIEYSDFADYWRPIESGEGSLGKLVTSQSPDNLNRLKDAVRKVYLSGAPDGPRSFSATTWVCKGCV
jgi:ubiquinone/menaquinone biosynthesis C-methylase UbiE